MSEMSRMSSKRRQKRWRQNHFTEWFAESLVYLSLSCISPKVILTHFLVYFYISIWMSSKKYWARNESSRFPIISIFHIYGAAHVLWAPPCALIIIINAPENWGELALCRKTDVSFGEHRNVVKILAHNNNNCAEKTENRSHNSQIKKKAHYVLRTLQRTQQCK